VSSPAVPRSASDHPETWRFGFAIYHAEDRPQWRSWLAHHHDTARGVWLCSWRGHTERPRCPYPEVVEEALCFGWIDSTNTHLDSDRSVQLITPRKSRSAWSRLSRQRAVAMEQQGLMTDAGRAAIQAAKVNGWWTISDQVEDLIEPNDLAAALDGDPGARTHWDGFSRRARRLMLWWIVSAVQPATRAQRIATVVVKASQGRPARE
jgi:uncharacterized protein YdeI (YjbR/CyaY-like superfamily)